MPIKITKQVATPELLNTVTYGIKKAVYEKTVNVDIMGLFTLTFAWVAGGFLHELQTSKGPRSMIETLKLGQFNPLANQVTSNRLYI